MELKENAEIEIDVKDLIEMLLSKIVWIAGITILCLILAIAVTKVLITPTYQSTAKIYVLNTKSETISSSDMQVATSLTSDYKEMVLGRKVLEMVIVELNLDILYETLKKNVVVSNPPSTRILEITVTDADPQTARNIAGKICEVAAENIVVLMGVERVNIIEDANLPSSPSGPNLTLNIFIGILIGLISSFGIFALIYIFDDKINKPDDIEKQLNISTLGMIPYQKSIER